MSKKQIAINGFGRIGRLVFRIIQERDDMEVVSINDLTDVETLAHLLKYDSAQGRFDGEVTVDGSDIVVNGSVIKVQTERNPANLPWGAMNIDVVVESTGVFRSYDSAYSHIEAGAKKVIISAPGSGDLKTIVMGVNDEILDGSEQIVSNASCTTNCLAPMVKVLNDEFGLESGFITTIHAYTSDQMLQDAPHSDLRRSRAAGVSMIPTSTGAAAAVCLVLPELKGRLDGLAIRVPTLTGSITDLTAELSQNVTVEEVNAVMRNAAEGPLKGVMQYCEEPIVSADIVGDAHSCIFDSGLTKVSKNNVKIFGWYDNEFGYASRVVDLADRL